MDLAQILETCPELFVDPESGGNGDGPAPAPLPQPSAPLVARDHVLRQEADPPEIVVPPATGGEAQEKPRRYRRRGSAAPVAGENGNGAPDLSETFLTIPDVARLFHMHPGSVWRLVCEGRLPGIKLGRVLIPAEAVTAFIEARKLKPRAWARGRKEPPGEA